MLWRANRTKPTHRCILKIEDERLKILGTAPCARCKKRQRHTRRHNTAPPFTKRNIKIKKTMAQPLDIIPSMSTKGITHKIGHIKRLGLDYYQSLGKRLGEPQQDFLGAWSLRAPMTRQNLSALFEAMAHAAKSPDIPKPAGTTVNLVAVHGRHILAANLGDSMSTLFSRKAQNSEITSIRLSELHTPHNPTEMKRLEEEIGLDLFGYYVGSDKRLYQFDGDRSYGTDMSRGLANHGVSGAYSTEPFIQEIEAEPAAYSRLVLYTDGMTNLSSHPHSDLEYDTDYHAQLIGCTKKYLAKEMGQFAENNGFYDNASAISLILDDSHTLRSEPLLLACLDGHGTYGHRLADAAISSIDRFDLCGARYL